MAASENQKSRTLVLDEREVRAQLAEVRAQLARYRILEGQLMSALELFDTGSFVENASDEGTVPGTVGRGSQRELIVETLMASDDALSVTEITNAVAEKSGQAVSRTSISPVLAKLKKAGLVEHDDNGWQWRR
jgi:replicative DNA helicase